MALINCPECNREVSDKAEICPNCGFGVAKYIERQNKIIKIQEEAEKEAYLYVKKKKKAEKEKAEQEKRAEENRKRSIYNEAVSKYGSESSKDVENARDLFLQIVGWKDVDVYLNKCKDRISKLKEQEKTQVEKYKRIRKKVIAITGTIVACVVIILGCHYFYKTIVVPKRIYDSAISNIEKENYEEAIAQLETIIEYKDANEQIKIAQVYIYERDYANAKELADERKYSEALSVLRELDTTKDVLELINLCENSLKYEEVHNLAESEKYREAIEILEGLGDFKDSINILGEYRLEADYLDALNYINNEDYKNAFSLLENLGDYKDAKEKYYEVCYQLGMTGFENQNYTAAKRYLEEVADIKDVADILSECELQLSYESLYTAAMNSIAASKLYDAIDYLNQIPSDYKDVVDKTELCNTYKDVVGEWKCVGYDGSDNRWITDESACRKHDFIVKVNNDGKLSFVNYKYDYKNLEYTGTTLKWEAVFHPNMLNISTGTLTYTTNFGGKDWTFKESYVHSK